MPALFCSIGKNRAMHFKLNHIQSFISPIDKAADVMLYPKQHVNITMAHGGKFETRLGNIEHYHCHLIPRGEGEGRKVK